MRTQNRFNGFEYERKTDRVFEKRYIGIGTGACYGEALARGRFAIAIKPTW